MTYTHPLLLLLLLLLLPSWFEPLPSLLQTTSIVSILGFLHSPWSSNPYSTHKPEWMFSKIKIKWLHALSQYLSMYFQCTQNRTDSQSPQRPTWSNLWLSFTYKIPSSATPCLYAWSPCSSWHTKEALFCLRNSPHAVPSVLSAYPIWLTWLILKYNIFRDASRTMLNKLLSFSLLLCPIYVHFILFMELTIIYYYTCTYAYIFVYLPH